MPSYDRTKMFTQSSLKCYTTCPFQFYLKYVKQVPPDSRGTAAFAGQCVHYCLDRLHQEDAFDRHAELYKECCDKLKDEDEYGDLPWKDDSQEEAEKKLEKNLEEGMEMIANYVLQRENIEQEVIATEAEFRLEIDDVKFAGTIDKVAVVDGEKRMIDYKSGKIRPPAEVLKRDIQFGLYELGLKFGQVIAADGEVIDVGGDNINSIYWYHMRDLIPYKKGKKIKGTDEYEYRAGDYRGPAWYKIPRRSAESSKKQIMNIVRAIKGGVFFMAPSALGSCTFCNVSQACSDFCDEAGENVF
jgi:hypothetical protein